MAVYGLEIPFGLLEPQSILLVLLGVFLLFALPLAGRRTIVALLFQLLAVLCEFLDFPALLSDVARRVVHWATCTSVIAVGRLSPQGPRPPPATVTAAVVVGAPASGWLLPLALFFFFFLFLLLPP
jgi:hypothetical protein